MDQNNLMLEHVSTWHSNTTMIKNESYHCMNDEVLNSTTNPSSSCSKSFPELTNPSFKFNEPSLSPVLHQNKWSVDVFDILRYEFTKSLISPNNIDNNEIHPLLLSQPISSTQVETLNILKLETPDLITRNYSWLLGDSFFSHPSPTVTHVPLLDLISVERQIINVENTISSSSSSSPRPLLIQFKSFNLSTDGSQLSSIKDRQGNYINIGDLVLFALQLQTGVSTSRHITSLGHIPVSFLLKKPITTLLNTYTLSAETILSDYDLNKFATVWRTDSSKPVTVDSLEILHRVFRQPISFLLNRHLIQIRDTTMIYDSDSQESLCTMTQTTHTHEKDSFYFEEKKKKRPLLNIVLDASYKFPLIKQKKRFTTTPAKQIVKTSIPNAIRLCQEVYDLVVALSPKPIGSSTLRLYEKACATTSIHQLKGGTCHSKNDPISSNNVSKEDFTQSHRFNHNNNDDRYNKTSTSSFTYNKSHFNHSSSTAVYKNSNSSNIQKSSNLPKTILETSYNQRSLYYYMKSKRMKPIIIVPNPRLSSAILHSENIRYFLEQKQLPQSSTLHNILQGSETHGFSWIGDIPLSNQCDGDKIATIEFKIIDGSHVSKFRPIDWYRTVAVILQGPDWQLSGWPFISIDNIFRCIKPFYFAYESESLPPLVKVHDVEVMRLRRTSRHNDATAWNQMVSVLGSILSSPRDFRLFDLNIMKNRYQK